MRLRCKLGFHKVEVNGDKSNIKTRYYECTACGKRWAAQRFGGYQPVDLAWERPGK